MAEGDTKGISGKLIRNPALEDRVLIYPTSF